MGDLNVKAARALDELTKLTHPEAADFHALLVAKSLSLWDLVELPTPRVRYLLRNFLYREVAHIQQAETQLARIYLDSHADGSMQEQLERLGWSASPVRPVSVPDALFTEVLLALEHHGESGLATRLAALPDAP